MELFSCLDNFKHGWKHARLHRATLFTRPVRDLLVNAHREPCTPSSMTESHARFLTSHPHLWACNLQPPTWLLNLQRLSLFSYFSPSLPPPVFMDQRREQLHQRRSGGLEMKSCVAMGKHLAVVRGAEAKKRCRQMSCRFFLGGLLEARRATPGGVWVELWRRGE